jgi:hypothetical protein
MSYHLLIDSDQRDALISFIDDAPDLDGREYLLALRQSAEELEFSRPFTELFLSEDQRLALLALFVDAWSDWLDDNDADNVLAYWQDMLEGLPAEEALDPGRQHDFCF